MADDERSQLVERVQLMRQVQAKRDAQGGASPQDPSQPPISAIGSNASPAAAQAVDQADNPDWVDQIKRFASKSANYKSTPQQIEGMPYKSYEQMNTGMPAAQGVIAPVAKAVSYPLQVGDRLADLGVEGGDKPAFSVPFTNDKKISYKDIENLLGNAAVPEVAGDAAAAAGPAIWKSGLKKIAQYGETVGKDPLSVLKKYGFTGGYGDAVDLFNNLKNKFQVEQPAAEEAATAAGAKPDMIDATKEARDNIQKYKDRWTINGKMDPGHESMIEAMENDVNRTKAKSSGPPIAQAQPEVPVVDLGIDDKNAFESPESSKPKIIVPVPRENAPPAMVAQDQPITSLPVPSKMIEQPGPTVTQVRQMKSETGGNADWTPEQRGAWNNHQKAMYSGQKRIAEESIGKTLGPQAQKDYSENNADWGNILTTEDRAKILANQEANKSTSQVTAMLAAAGGHGVPAAIANELTRAMKTGAFKTKLGSLLEKSAPYVAPTGQAVGVSQQINPWGSQ